VRDVSKKIKTLRTAIAQATLKTSPETIALINRGEIPKGDPLPVAKVAAIQAAKNTSQIIPYCHPLPIEYVGVEFELGANTVVTTVTVKAIYKTGVEMEALTAASVAALTLYDMMKMLDEEMEISGVRLLEKMGGKSDFKQDYGKPLRAAVVVMSDSIAAGKKDDYSGKLILDRLTAEGVEIADYKVIADDLDTIETTLRDYADVAKVDLIMTTGGTGLSPRDCTPEAMKRLIEREIPGIAEAARSYGQERTPYSMLSRGVSGVRGQTVIVNLPGSRGGVADSLDALIPSLLHSFHVLRGGGHAAKQKSLAEHKK
jgi:molybdenum cofactor biosynthesis protein MoaC